MYLGNNTGVDRTLGTHTFTEPPTLFLSLRTWRNSWRQRSQDMSLVQKFRDTLSLAQRKDSRLLEIVTWCIS